MADLCANAFARAFPGRIICQSIGDVNPCCGAGTFSGILSHKSRFMGIVCMGMIGAGKKDGCFIRKTDGVLCRGNCSGIGRFIGGTIILGLEEKEAADTV